MATTKKKATKAKKTAKRDTPEMLRDQDIERVQVEREIPVPIDSEDVSRAAVEHAQVTLKIRALTDEITALQTKHRPTLRELRKDEQRLAHTVLSGMATRKVTCTEERIFATMTIRVLDHNGKILEEKAMPKEMLQRDFVAETETGARTDLDDGDDGDESVDDD